MTLFLSAFSAGYIAPATSACFPCWMSLLACGSRLPVSSLAWSIWVGCWIHCIRLSDITLSPGMPVSYLDSVSLFRSCFLALSFI